MGMAGAPLPYYIGYIEPAAAFGLPYAVNSIAMPMIGGTTSWVGPLIGAILLGTLQQIATVTISSAVNLLIVGVLLVAFVIIAPERHRRPGRRDWRRTRARAAVMSQAPLLEVKGLSASASAASSPSTASTSTSRRASASA